LQGVASQYPLERIMNIDKKNRTPGESLVCKPSKKDTLRLSFAEEEDSLDKTLASGVTNTI
jgi:hypothetical protein